MSNISIKIRPSIANLKPYSSAKEEYTGTNSVFLDANENPFGTLNRYPDPLQKDLKAILAQQNNTSRNNVFIGNGSDEILDLVFRLFCEPGNDQAITFSPTYGMYQVLADINNINLINLPLDETFNPNPNQIAPYLDDSSCKLLLLCSPNNPSGNDFDREKMIDIIKDFSGIVLVDEAYIEFSEQESLVNLIDQFPNLIVSRTMSKAWGLAAARIGVAFANEELIAWMNRIKPPYNVGLLNQEAAIEALMNTNLFDANLKAIVLERTILFKELDALEIVIKRYPSASNFILVEVPDANKLYEYLIGLNIVVRNRNTLVSNCLRISIGTKEENETLITALKNYKS